MTSFGGARSLSTASLKMGAEKGNTMLQQLVPQSWLSLISCGQVETILKTTKGSFCDIRIICRMGQGLINLALRNRCLRCQCLNN